MVQAEELKMQTQLAVEAQEKLEEIQKQRKQMARRCKEQQKVLRGHLTQLEGGYAHLANEAPMDAKAMFTPGSMMASQEYDAGGFKVPPKNAEEIRLVGLKYIAQETDNQVR